MSQQIFSIKHMCCQRCIEAVEGIFRDLGFTVQNVRLGEIVVSPKAIANEVISLALIQKGFELVVSEEERTVEAVKTAIIELVHFSPSNDTEQRVHLPDFIESKVSKPYRSINKLFLRSTNLTIEKYTILQRIERIKGLIEQGEHNFSQIAYLLGYKTQQHLSNQFKKIEGVSMLEYKLKKMKTRKHIDKI